MSHDLEPEILRQHEFTMVRASVLDEHGKPGIQSPVIRSAYKDGTAAALTFSYDDREQSTVDNGDRRQTGGRRDVGLQLLVSKLPEDIADLIPLCPNGIQLETWYPTTLLGKKTTGWSCYVQLHLNHASQAGYVFSAVRLRDNPEASRRDIIYYNAVHAVDTHTRLSTEEETEAWRDVLNQIEV